MRRYQHTADDLSARDQLEADFRSDVREACRQYGLHVHYEAEPIPVLDAADRYLAGCLAFDRHLAAIRHHQVIDARTVRRVS